MIATLIARHILRHPQPDPTHELAGRIAAAIIKHGLDPETVTLDATQPGVVIVTGRVRR